MRKTIIFLLVNIVLCCACSGETNEVDESVSKDNVEALDLKKVDDVYVAMCDRISYDDFIEMFAPGWAWDGVYDIFPDGSIGVENLAQIDGGALSPFSIQPDNVLRIYNSYMDEAGVVYYNTLGNYVYNESGNILEMSGLYLFNGGTLIKLTESEMEIVAPLWIPSWSEVDAVLNLYRFKRLTQDKVDTLESLALESLGEQ